MSSHLRRKRLRRAVQDAPASDDEPVESQPLFDRRHLSASNDSFTIHDTENDDSEDSCTVCLGHLSDECWLDCCDHSFCFTCIYRWCSDITNNCPLCKQRVTQIRHWGEEEKSQVEPANDSDSEARDQWQAVLAKRSTNRELRSLCSRRSKSLSDAADELSLESSPAAFGAHVEALNALGSQPRRLTRSMSKPLVTEQSPKDNGSFFSLSAKRHLDRLTHSKVQRSLMILVPIADRQQRVAYDGEQPPSPSILNAACTMCDRDDHEDQLLLCDGCDAAWHTYCVGLADVPDGDWFCPTCISARDYQLSLQLAVEEEDVIEISPASSVSEFRSSPPTPLAQRSQPAYESPPRSGPIRPIQPPQHSTPTSRGGGDEDDRLFDQDPIDLHDDDEYRPSSPARPHTLSTPPQTRSQKQRALRHELTRSNETNSVDRMRAAVLNAQRAAQHRELLRKSNQSRAGFRVTHMPMPAVSLPVLTRRLDAVDALRHEMLLEQRSQELSRRKADGSPMYEAMLDYAQQHQLSPRATDCTTARNRRSSNGDTRRTQPSRSSDCEPDRVQRKIPRVNLFNRSVTASSHPPPAATATSSNSQPQHQVNHTTVRASVPVRSSSLASLPLPAPSPPPLPPAPNPMHLRSSLQSLVMARTNAATARAQQPVARTPSLPHTSPSPSSVSSDWSVRSDAVLPSIPTFTEHVSSSRRSKSRHSRRLEIDDDHRPLVDRVA